MNLQATGERLLGMVLEYVHDRAEDPMMCEEGENQKFIEICNNWSDGSGRREHGRGLNHVIWMLEGISRGYVQHDKGHRWLGYVQGILVQKKIFTLEEMKKVNKDT